MILSGMFKNGSFSTDSIFPDEQSEDHHDQAVSIFTVRVVKKQINLPYSCARRTTCCAVEADISKFLSKAAEMKRIALLQKSSDQ